MRQPEPATFAVDAVRVHAAERLSSSSTRRHGRAAHGAGGPIGGATVQQRLKYEEYRPFLRPLLQADGTSNTLEDAMGSNDDETLAAAVQAAICEAEQPITECRDLNTQGCQEALAWLRGVRGLLQRRAKPPMLQWLAHWALSRPGYDHFIHAFASLTPVTRAVCTFRRFRTTDDFQQVRLAVHEVLRTAEGKLATTGRLPTDREAKHMQWLAMLAQPSSLPDEDYGRYYVGIGCWPPPRDDD